MTTEQLRAYRVTENAEENNNSDKYIQQDNLTIEI